MGGLLANPIEYCSKDGCIRLPVSVADPKDQKLQSILKEAIREFTKLHARVGIQTLPEDTLLEYILRELLILIVDDQYVIGLDVVQPWFSDTKTLSEEFLYRYRVGDSGLQEVSDALVAVAKELECSRVDVGTLGAVTKQRHLALARMYESGGFEVDSVHMRRIT